MSWSQLPLILCIASSPVRPAAASAVAAPQSSPERDAEGHSDNSEEAEDHRLAAIKAFEAGDLDLAITEFEAARALDPDPAYIFNIGRVYEEKGDLARALELYEEFVRAPRVELEEREAAQERAARLKKILEPPQQDDGTQPEDPAEQPAVVETPRRSSDNVRDASSRPLIISGSVLLSLGAAVAIGGGVGFGLAGSQIADDVDQVRDGNPQGRTLTEVEDLDARGRSANMWQIITASAGGAVAVVGAALLAVGLSRRAKAKRAAALTPTGTVWASGGGVGLRGRF